MLFDNPSVSFAVQLPLHKGAERFDETLQGFPLRGSSAAGGDEVEQVW